MMNLAKTENMIVDLDMASEVVGVEEITEGEAAVAVARGEAASDRDTMSIILNIPVILHR